MQGSPRVEMGVDRTGISQWGEAGRPRLHSRDDEQVMHFWQHCRQPWVVGHVEILDEQPAVITHRRLDNRVAVRAAQAVADEDFGIPVPLALGADADRC